MPTFLKLLAQIVANLFTAGPIDAKGNTITNIRAASQGGEAVEYDQYVAALAEKLDGAAVGVSVAQLIDGKVPLSQLPDLVGRKLQVADDTERLALATDGDLTIAFQSDTGDVWVLSGGEDPSVPSNWSKVGSAGANVASVFGRTGVVSAEAGDYSADQISATADGSRTGTTVAAQLAELDASKVSAALTSGWVLLGIGGVATAVRLVEAEVPVTSDYTVYTLAHTPAAATEPRIFVNGIRVRAGVGNDYTRSGVTLTFASALSADDVVLADYYAAD